MSYNNNYHDDPFRTIAEDFTAQLDSMGSSSTLLEQVSHKNPQTRSQQPPHHSQHDTYGQIAGGTQYDGDDDDDDEDDSDKLNENDLGYDSDDDNDDDDDDSDADDDISFNPANMRHHLENENNNDNFANFDMNGYASHPPHNPTSFSRFDVPHDQHYPHQQQHHHHHHHQQHQHHQQHHHHHQSTALSSASSASSADSSSPSPLAVPQSPLSNTSSGLRLVQASFDDVCDRQLLYIRNRKVIVTCIDYPLVFWRYIDTDVERQSARKFIAEGQMANVTANGNALSVHFYHSTLSALDMGTLVSTSEFHRSFQATSTIFQIDVEDRRNTRLLQQQLQQQQMQQQQQQTWDWPDYGRHNDDPGLLDSADDDDWADFGA